MTWLRLKSLHARSKKARTRLHHSLIYLFILLGFGLFYKLRKTQKQNKALVLVPLTELFLDQDVALMNHKQCKNSFKNIIIF